ncbi:MULTISPECIES: TIM-barrel domain-containing protein [unclassified Fusibacter]|uniref:TIM-barrel domain-containing protein n=1 Tax=unclassified Fusibacter TaxID=2624464 RepID=UPI001010D846|nr:MULTISPECIES: TIM-barrel domain-containing protein [unclassified Fusibacter]MCK8061053.1 hypothetical protein [Fusibacter sp. A2]NPE20493.1 hypothetical protein [Fusibacter sp. A1]RXV63693.1 hypothetical protein DWB64_01580 [Fusibacter sp. A1]
MNEIVIDQARFTCITPSLVRMEYSEKSDFENRKSVRLQVEYEDQTFMTVNNEGDQYTLKTSDLTIEYQSDGQSFHDGNLRVYSHNVHWQPDQVDNSNLGGVHLAMDCIQRGMIPNSVHSATKAYHHNDSEYHLWRYLFGESDVVDPDVHYDEHNLSLEQLLALKPLENLSLELQKLIKERLCYPPGLLSESGYFLYNDSKTPVYDHSKWPVERIGSNLDYYIFIYDTDYRKALRDYRRLFGATPMIPKYTLGLWFSRYPTRNQNELLQLVETFKEKELPLDVLVLDLEWHKSGWYGFDWNHDEFPTPNEYIKTLKEQNIYTVLNVHPDGVPVLDAGFDEFESKSSIKRETSKEICYIDLYQKKTSEAFMEVFHQPQFDKGIEFWWIDGSSHVSLESLGNQFFTNEVYMDHIRKQNDKRPIICSRSAGLGSHRHAIHFTGDTYCQFEVLKSQVEYTLRAGHIGQSFISHDIGGHMWPYKHINPELLCRWYQFGAMSPIFRLHSSGGSERLPWIYDSIVESALKNVMYFRMTLMPYLYTLVKESHETCLPMLRSNILSDPQWGAGKTCWDSYYLGDRIYCTPILDERGFRWINLPKGTWFSGFMSEVIKSDGNKNHYIINKVDQLPPHYYKANKLIVKQPYELRASSTPKKIQLELYWEKDLIDDCYTLYEDDGYTNDCDKDYMETTFCLKGEETFTLDIRVNQNGQFDVPHRIYDLTVYSTEPFKLNGKMSTQDSKDMYHSVHIDNLDEITQFDIS